MAQLTNFGQNNPLWRRVQRHAQMSALFGERPTAVSTSPAPQSTSSLTDLPTEPPETTTVSTAPSVYKPVQPSPPPSRSFTDVAHRTPAAQTPASDPDSGSGDASWRRLQKIHQLHQQKVQSAPSATPNPERQPAETDFSPPEAASPTAQPRPTVVSAPPTAVSPPSPPESQKTPPVVNRKAATPPSTSPEETITQTLAKVAPEQKTDASVELLPPSRPRPSTPARPASAAPEPPPAPTDRELIDAEQSSESFRPSQPSTTIPSQPTIQRQPDTTPPLVAPTAVSPTASPPDEMAVSPDLHSIDQPITPDATQPPAATSRLVPTDIGPLPADLWELLGEPAPSATPTTEQPSAPSPSSTASPPTAVPQPIQRQPEPKEDRPATPAAPPPSGQSANQPSPQPVATPKQPTVVSQSIQRHPEPKGDRLATSAAAPTDALAHLVNQPGSRSIAPQKQPTAVSQSIQRQPDPASSRTRSQPALAAESAPTHPPLEQALGLTPALPESPPPEPASAQPPASQTAVQQMVQRAEQPPPPAIHRFPEMGGIETAVAEAVPPGISAPLADLVEPLVDEPDEEPSAGPEDNDIDLDELSRRVYQALKRKLATERERGYGR